MPKCVQAINQYSRTSDGVQEQNMDKQLEPQLKELEELAQKMGADYERVKAESAGRVRRTEYATGAHWNGAGMFFCRREARAMQVSSGSTSHITDTGIVEQRRSLRTSSTWGPMPQNSRIPGAGLRHIARNFSQARSSPSTVPSPYRIRQPSIDVYGKPVSCASRCATVVLPDPSVPIIRILRGLKRSLSIF